MPPQESLDVLFVSMPFGPLQTPSIGLSQLRAVLDDVRCEIEYFGLQWGAEIGTEAYDWFARSDASRARLAGEWVFTTSAFGPQGASPELYAREVLENRAHFGPIDPLEIERVLEVQRLATGFVDACCARVLQLDPKIVGFTSVFQQQLGSLALAQRIKERRPDIRIVFGGANCEGDMGREVARQFPFVDAVVSGEAEHLIRPLVQALLRGADPPRIAGIHSHHGEPPAEVPEPVLDLDALPAPEYDDFFRQLSALGLEDEVDAEVPFETSRGCWWGQVQHCTFCGLNGTTLAYRSKSAPRALAELDDLRARYPQRRIQVVDNILDMKYFADFLPALAAQESPPELFYEVKANLRKDQIELLRRAGVTRIQPGIESLSDSVLQTMRKGVSGLQNVRLLKWCLELGVQPGWLFLWGFPGEEESEYERMARWMPLLSHLPPPHLGQRVRADRFSPSYENGEELGFLNLRPAPAYPYAFPLPASSLAELAYTFDYDYADGRDVHSYTRPVAAAIEGWRGDHEESALVWIDKDDGALVWDSRPIATRPLHQLDAAQRDLLAACDDIRSAAQLETLLAESARAGRSTQPLDRVLTPLLDDGLVLEDGGRYLALPIAAAS